MADGQSRFALAFQLRDLSQPAAMSIDLAVFGSKERLDEISCHGRAYGPSAHAWDTHVIGLNPMLGRKKDCGMLK